MPDKSSDVNNVLIDSIKRNFAYNPQVNSSGRSGGVLKKLPLWKLVSEERFPGYIINGSILF